MHEQIKIILPPPLSASPLPLAFSWLEDSSAVRLLLIVIRREPGKGQPIARALLHNCLQACTVLDISFAILTK